MGTCRLCTEEKDLIKKSHIYPNFVYSDLFDKHGKLRKFDALEMKKINPRISKPASGAYEGNLLCAECDNVKISQLENYVAELLNGRDKKVTCNIVNVTDGTEIIEVENLKYVELKNFVLSLLFRADICSFPEFGEVSLGPYREKIRKVIYENLATEDLDFQINVFKLSDDSEFSTLIGQPVRSKIRAETVYSILMKGYMVIINIKPNNVSQKILDIRLKSNGKMAIPVIPKKNEQKIILNYFGVS